MAHSLPSQRTGTLCFIRLKTRSMLMSVGGRLVCHRWLSRREWCAVFTVDAQPDCCSERADYAMVPVQAAEVVQMRYFVGMTVPEIAVALDLAPRTVDRHWAFARAWLKRTIRSSLSDPAGPD